MVNYSAFSNVYSLMPPECFEPNVGNEIKIALKNFIENKSKMSKNSKLTYTGFKKRMYLKNKDKDLLAQYNTKNKNCGKDMNKVEKLNKKKYANKFVENRPHLEIIEVDIECDSEFKENEDCFATNSLENNDPLIIDLLSDSDDCIELPKHNLSQNHLNPVVVLKRLDLKKSNLKTLMKKSTINRKKILKTDNKSPVVVLERLDLKNCNLKHFIKNSTTKNGKIFKEKNDKSSKNSLLAQALQGNVTNECYTGIDETEYITIEVDPMFYFPHLPFHVPSALLSDKIYPIEEVIMSEKMYYNCSICRKSYKLYKSMMRHMLESHGIEDLKSIHSCEFCTQVFRFRHELGSHLSVHTNDEGYMQCPEGCNHYVVRNKSMGEHKALKHPHLGTLGRNWFYSWMQ